MDNFACVLCASSFTSLVTCLLFVSAPLCFHSSLSLGFSLVIPSPVWLVILHFVDEILPLRGFLHYTLLRWWWLAILAFRVALLLIPLPSWPFISAFSLLTPLPAWLIILSITLPIHKFFFMTRHLYSSYLRLLASIPLLNLYDSYLLFIFPLQFTTTFSLLNFAN